MHCPSPYTELIKICHNNKAEFDLMVDRFFSVCIDPAWESYGRRKLGLAGSTIESIFLTYGSKGRHVERNPIGYDWGGTNSFGRNWVNIFDECVKISGGGCLYQRAFVYYLFSDVERWVGRVGKSSLKTLFVESGIPDVSLGRLTNYRMDSEAFHCWEVDVNDYTDNMSANWINLAFTQSKFGFSDLVEDHLVNLYEMLDISGMGDFVSDGYFNYVESISTKEVGVPSKIVNRFDFEVWKKKISEVRITGKNIDEIMYSQTDIFTHPFGMEMSRYISTTYPSVYSRVYFGKWRI